MPAKTWEDLMREALDNGIAPPQIAAMYTERAPYYSPTPAPTGFPYPQVAPQFAPGGYPIPSQPAYPQFTGPLPPAQPWSPQVQHAAQPGCVTLTQQDWALMQKERGVLRARILETEARLTEAATRDSNADLQVGFLAGVEAHRFLLSAVHPGTLRGVPVDAMERCADAVERNPAVPGYRELPRMLRKKAAAFREADLLADRIDQEKETTAKVARMVAARAGATHEEQIRAQETAVADLDRRATFRPIEPPNATVVDAMARGAVEVREEAPTVNTDGLPVLYGEGVLGEILTAIKAGAKAITNISERLARLEAPCEAPDELQRAPDEPAAPIAGAPAVVEDSQATQAESSPSA